MIYLAAAAVVALIAVTLTFAQVVRWLIREHARERNLMLNQLLHLAGRTWQPPPAGEPEPTPEPEYEHETYDPAELTYP